MRRIILNLSLGLAAISSAYAQSCPPCGPTYCMGTSQHASALAKKKAAATKEGYPTRMVALYDKLDAAEACVTGSPDGFNLFVVKSDGSITVDSWDNTNEKNDAAGVEAGKLKSCFVVLQRRACVGCNQIAYDKRADYDSKLDLNKSLAIACQK